MKYWIGVVSEEHAKRGETLGIARAGHGKHTVISRMQAGDWIVYYSPYETLADKRQVQAFTTIGQVTDNTIHQADEGDFKPWQRNVQYYPCQPASIRPLLNVLSFTAGRAHWGYAFKFGLFEVSEQDFQIIERAMQVK